MALPRQEVDQFQGVIGLFALDLVGVALKQLLRLRGPTNLLQSLESGAVAAVKPEIKMNTSAASKKVTPCRVK